MHRYKLAQASPDGSIPYRLTTRLNQGVVLDHISTDMTMFYMIFAPRYHIAQLHLDQGVVLDHVSIDMSDMIFVVVQLLGH